MEAENGSLKSAHSGLDKYLRVRPVPSPLDDAQSYWMFS